MAIPVVALIVAASFSAGGPEALFMSLEATMRHLVGSATDLLRTLF